MAEVFVSSAAEWDFTEALCWYAERSLSSAVAFESAVDNAFGIIGMNPLRFPACDENHRYYLLQQFPYQVIYRYFNSEVTVVALAHTSRDPSFWKQR